MGFIVSGELEGTRRHVTWKFNKGETGEYQVGQSRYGAINLAQWSMMEPGKPLGPVDAAAAMFALKTNGAKDVQVGYRAPQWMSDVAKLLRAPVRNTAPTT